MNTNTTKLISPERVAELFDCYGANPDSWPDDERAIALALIQNSSGLQSLQREAEKLDQFLVNGDEKPETKVPVNSKLVARIVDHLPEQDGTRQHGSTSDRKHTGHSWFNFNGWIGMAAASIAVFVISVSILNLQPSSLPNEQPALVQTELDEWMWEQVTGETDTEDEEPMTIMALLEME